MRESCTSGSERGKPCKGLTYLPVNRGFKFHNIKTTPRRAYVFLAVLVK